MLPNLIITHVLRTIITLTYAYNREVRDAEIMCQHVLFIVQTTKYSSNCTNQYRENIHLFVQFFYFHYNIVQKCFLVYQAMVIRLTIS